MTGPVVVAIVVAISVRTDDELGGDKLGALGLRGRTSGGHGGGGQA